MCFRYGSDLTVTFGSGFEFDPPFFRKKHFFKPDSNPEFSKKGFFKHYYGPTNLYCAIFESQPWHFLALY